MYHTQYMYVAYHVHVYSISYTSRLYLFTHITASSIAFMYQYMTLYIYTTHSCIYTDLYACMFISYTQIFIELALRAEQEEYEREGIQWLPIPFFNNRIVCELLDGVQPPGVFRILDDACKALHGSQDTMDIDRKFIDTASKIYNTHAHFISNSKSFIIKHYAGDVSYTLG